VIGPSRVTNVSEASADARVAAITLQEFASANSRRRALRFRRAKTVAVRAGFDDVGVKNRRTDRVARPTLAARSSPIRRWSRTSRPTIARYVREVQRDAFGQCVRRRGPFREHWFRAPRRAAREVLTIMSD
jgi:hypothetical protein